MCFIGSFARYDVEFEVVNLQLRDPQHAQSLNFSMYAPDAMRCTETPPSAIAAHRRKKLIPLIVLESVPYSCGFATHWIRW
jgi:hypothetical protein